MSQIEIRLPKMGESVTEATITNWLKNVGDTIALDEPLVEVATDKVDNELPSEAEGTLIQRLFEVDQVAQVGDVIAIISTDGSAAVASSPAEKIETEIKEVVASVQSNAAPAPIKLENNSNSDKFYSPLVKSIAEKEGINYSQLDTIEGSGQGGRVTKKDIIAFIANGNAENTAKVEVKAPASNGVVTAPTQAAPSTSNGGGFLSNIKEPVVTAGPNDEIIEMDRMRKLIADHMVCLLYTSDAADE